MPVDDLPIVLDRGGSEPLAVQVADALRNAASTGTLRVGDRLTSTRELATRLGVSRTVTAAAYDQLLAEGWLAGRRGSGTFVTAAPPNLTPACPSRPPRSADPSVPPATMVDLTAGRPCLDALDRAAWRRAWRTAGDRMPAPDPEFAGHPDFSQAVVDHLLRHRGLAAPPGHVLATSGTTSALAEVAAQLPRGARVALEEPGYQRAAVTLEAAGLRVVTVPVDENGMRVDQLPDGIAAVYCTPAHQFPLGSRLSADRRVTLVRRAWDEGFLVLEDDYDGELRYDVAPLPLLASLCPDVVVHLGTTSKLLTPTLGTGWLVAPPALHSRILETRRRTCHRPSPAGQMVFAAFADYGDLSRHLRRLRRELSERRAMVVDMLRAVDVEFHGDAAGAHLMVSLPSAEAEAAVVAGAVEAGVTVPGLLDYHHGRPSVFGISIGYASAGRADLDWGVELVAKLAAEAH